MHVLYTCMNLRAYYKHVNRKFMHAYNTYMNLRAYKERGYKIDVLRFLSVYTYPITHFLTQYLMITHFIYHLYLLNKDLLK